MWQKSNIIKKGKYIFNHIPVILDPNNTYTWDSGERVPFSKNNLKQNKTIKH